MKKRTTKRLELSRETILSLSNSDSAKVLGLESNATYGGPSCDSAVPCPTTHPTEFQ